MKTYAFKQQNGIQVVGGLATLRRPVIGIASLFAMASISGCGTITDISDDVFTVDKFAVYRTSDEIKSADQTAERFQDQPNAVALEELKLYADANDVKTRNVLIEFLLARSNEKCESHKAKIVGYNAIINFGASETTTLLAGAGAIVAGPVGAKVLSAGAAASSASQSHFNENFYQNFIGPAIIREIAAKRSVVLTEIKSKRNLSIDEYTKDEAVGDVLSYHAECSFYRGLQYLTQEKEKRTDPLNGIDANIGAIKQSIAYYEGKIASYIATGDVKSADQMRKTLLELHDNLAVQEKVKQVVRAGTSAPPQSSGSGPADPPGPVS